MLKNKIARSLFRHLLRWNRRPEVVGTRFSLNAESLGLQAEAIPGHYENNIRNAEGVQAMIFHCFRTLPPSQQNIEMGFKVLRGLNKASVDLLELSNAKASRLTAEAEEKAKFRIGQIVKYNSIRGVVTGWKLGQFEKEAVQVVDVLPDNCDVNVLTKRKRKRFAKGVTVPSTELNIVTDKNMHRVSNDKLSEYFIGYDPTRGRFIPTDDMQHSYQEDIDVLESTIDPCLEKVPTEELEKLNESLHSVLKTVSDIGRDMSEIVHKHAEIFQLEDKEKTTIKYFEGETVAQQVLHELGRCICGCFEEVSTEVCNITYISKGGSVAAPAKQERRFFQALRRGGAFRKLPSSQSVANSAAAVILSARGSDIVRMNAVELTRVYRALGHLANSFGVVDQMLQLRFQSKGLAYHDGLYVDHTATPDNSVSVAGKSRVREVSNGGDEQTEQLNRETAEPAAVFKLGQVVRHKTFGYRGVIAGFAMRPELDELHWGRVVDLKLGIEQPMYKVCNYYLLFSRVAYFRTWCFGFLKSPCTICIRVY